MANLITGSRIILSVIMFFLPAYSYPFYCCFLLAGFTDMIDGTVARMREETSEFGSRIDSIADMIFAAASVYKFFPILKLPVSIWIWTSIIVLIKLINIISGYVIKKKFVSMHTMANKITGMMLFFFPLSVAIVDIRFSAIVVCMAATFAAIQEGHFIRSGQKIRER